MSKKLTTERFIERAAEKHLNKFNYTSVTYINNATKVNIICPIHGMFEQTPKNHMHHGCDGCARDQSASDRTKSISILLHEFEKVHGTLYGYDRVADVYANNKTKIPIYCNHHGRYFYQKASAHLDGCGCPDCSSSKGERAVHQFLRDNCITFETQYSFNKTCRNPETNKPMRFDFYLPTFNMCVEFDGIQHFHSDYSFGSPENREDRLKDIQHRDVLKNAFCDENNINLLRISYLDQERVSEILTTHLINC